MIYVNRDQRDKSGKPIRPESAWFERARDETDKALRQGRSHRVSRYVYSHYKVRAALERLFCAKCAYCESKPTPSSDWDVEHFRPVNRVDERPDHPGYYWLAYEWNNLYMSCKHCNQRRNIRRGWSGPVQATVGGKMCQFPIANEDARAMNPSYEIEEEEPLLIDPCHDNPEAFLSYDIMGNIFAKDGNRMATTTIEVFHLSRRTLRDARRETVGAVCLALKLLFQLKNGDRLPSEELRGEVYGWYLRAGARHAAVARAIVGDPQAFGINKSFDGHDLLYDNE